MSDDPGIVRIILRRLTIRLGSMLVIAAGVILAAIRYLQAH
jgi:hypothetical protein